MTTGPFRFSLEKPHGNLTPEQYDALMSALRGEPLDVYQARNRELARRVRLIGRPVVITLATNPTVQVVGELLAFTDDGDVTYRSTEGEVRFAWPLLDVERRYSPPDPSTHD